MSSFMEIKQKVKISDVVGGHVRLTERSGRLFGLCPFHEEKTPSFIVSDELGKFYCFGCNAHGDVFDFLSKLLGISDHEALEYLAKDTGTIIDSKPDTKTMFFAKVAEIFMVSLLDNVEALNYLKKRGVDQTAIKLWSIGFFSLEKLKEFTDNLTSEARESFSDFVQLTALNQLANRIIFPIHDKTGAIIAFSGRNLDIETQTPKYINTKNTESFKKGSCFYGLHRCKQTLKKDSIYVVEGFFDVILMDTLGLKAIATMGTAITDDHVRILEDRQQKFVFLFDGDSAGQSAIFKLFSKRMIVKYSLFSCYWAVPLSEEEDAASLALQDQAKFRDILAQPLDMYEFIYNYVYGTELPENPTRTDHMRLESMLSLIAQKIVRNSMRERFIDFYRGSHKHEKRPESSPTTGRENFFHILYLALSRHQKACIKRLPEILPLLEEFVFRRKITPAQIFGQIKAGALISHALDSLNEILNKFMIDRWQQKIKPTDDSPDLLIDWVLLEDELILCSRGSEFKTEFFQTVSKIQDHEELMRKIARHLIKVT
ncbi:DNA primase [Abalone shriveling syndrome-associated virus]|uniref:DNA primase n=1 Tax=Abalone shriveling syndrome-associated virus TaxID=491893 RepID=UPI0001881BB9|nr:DNA primase [Abalone shriveling syndrome-associated virus]ACJ71994.1 primase [Abalone shriveling syndrome-associated virus]